MWEVSDIDFDYFFVRENCSYRLLSLIDAVRPDAQLTTGDAFPLYAIPVDTIRALDRAGLIVEREFRPSPASRLRADFSRLDAGQAAQVLQLANGELGLAEFQRRNEGGRNIAVMLSLASRLLAFRGEAESPLANDLLAARSRLPDAPMADYPGSTSPEQGHNSARVTAGGGRRAGAGFVELSIRPGFHDLADPPDDFVEGAGLNVFDTRVRWFDGSDTLRLEQLRFFNAVSLSPVRRWMTPLSWQFDVLLDRTYLDESQSTLAMVTRGGMGFSARRRSLDLYAMAMLEAALADRFDRDYTLLAGLQLGAVITSAVVACVCSWNRIPRMRASSVTVIPSAVSCRSTSVSIPRCASAIAATATKPLTMSTGPGVCSGISERNLPEVIQRKISKMRG